MNLLVSACLLGCACRYDGGAKPCAAVRTLAAKHTLIPVCPEIYGGLPTPRTPCEIVGDRVLAMDGADRTDAYRRGAAETLHLAETLGCRAALLKARSPACGSGEIYDGSFSGTLTAGDGVAAAALKAAGIAVFGENRLSDLEEWLKTAEK